MVGGPDRRRRVPGATSPLARRTTLPEGQGRIRWGQTRRPPNRPHQGRMLSDPRWAPNRVDLSYPAPGHASRYRRTFGCPVSFSADANRLVLPVDLLDRPVVTQHEPTRQAAVELTHQLMGTDEVRTDVVALVESLLEANLRRPLTMRDVAARLHRSDDDGRADQRLLAQERPDGRIGPALAELHADLPAEVLPFQRHRADAAPAARRVR